MHVQIFVREIQWQADAFPGNGRGKCRDAIEVERVAELIMPGRATGLDARCPVAGIVAPEA